MVELSILIAVVMIFRDIPGTINAVTEYRKAKPPLPPRAPKQAKQGAMSGYLWTVWDTKWQEMAEKYPERSAKARARREKRHAERREVWEHIKAKASDALGPDGEAKAGEPAKRKQEEAKPESAPAPTTPEPAADDAQPKPESVPNADQNPTPKTEPVWPKASAVPAHEQPTPPAGTNVLQFRRNPTIEGDDMADPNATEVLGLQGATRYTRALHATAQKQQQKLEEQAAQMRQGGVGQAAILRFEQAAAEAEHFTALAAEAVELCEKQLVVRDAYEAAPNAGNKQWFTSQQQGV
ncbi:hypothetical protein [Allonocardiopsis opalescens]|uniref:Uncharacterized protein n=1 Tax=Allonocardiopsis opalescens TaxID=1144618 RepID=A0A2T0PSZ0_9ACTN|nr:hypothetical protein [Allonocardiopsis opalescens]PRX92013.1 hypothetical protein CLV72_11286 [Allonocardiopsis opalescens]